MSSYATVVIGGLEVAAFRNNVEPTFMFLFRAEDLRRTLRHANEDDEEGATWEFVLSAEKLRDRLDMLGIGRETAVDAFDQIVASTLEHRTDFPVPDAVRDMWEVETCALRELNYEGWLSRVRSAASRSDASGRRLEVGSLRWLTAMWDYCDPRLVVRAFVDAFPDQTVVLDVTDLEGGGWLDPQLAPQEAALRNFSWAVANGAPAIVLPEGSSDVWVLEQALLVRQPHLEGFLRFADFSFGAEGGAGALVRTVRSLATAGIANRVVAIFDNDTAAADAMRAMDGTRLPDNIKTITYPPIKLARHYPTLGPTGSQIMDVNGLAGSLELYLGEDVLRGESGELRPVQWTGYIQRMGRYQGELMGKSSILSAFRTKLALAREEPLFVARQDWSGIDAIFDRIRHALVTM